MLAMVLSCARQLQLINMELAFGKFVEVISDCEILHYRIMTDSIRSVDRVNLPYFLPTNDNGKLLSS